MAPSPLPEIRTIAGGGYVACIAPGMGGRITRLTHVRGGEVLVPVDVTAPFAPDAWPRAGAYPLFPFHNRLPGAVFDHDGATVRLRGMATLGGDVMHGPAHKRPWKVLEEGPGRITLGMDWRPDPDWPFAFAARQEFGLWDGGLEVGLALVNTGTAPMPGGIGWHPYLAAGAAGDTRLDARSEWALDERGLPRGSRPHPRAPGPLPRSTGWTLHLADWSRAMARLDSGAWVELGADATLDQLAVHRMPGYLCLEPVSHAAGALARPAESRGVTGMARLAPGETLAGRVRLSVRDASTI